MKTSPYAEASKSPHFRGFCLDDRSTLHPPPRLPEPTYNGHPLSYWVQEDWLGGPDEDRAIQSMGTNAFPFLLQWLRAPEPVTHYYLANIASKLPPSLRPAWADSGYIPRGLLSAHAFQALGDQATPVVRDLSILAADTNNPDGADMALTALSYMGSNGVPPLLAAVRNPSHPFRSRAVYMLGQSKNLGPNADAVITELVAELKDPAVNQDAARALGDLKSTPAISVPALAHCLEASNDAPNFRAVAAISLIWFEENAKPALPYLTNALGDPDPEVRRTVANSIQQIHSSMRKADYK